MRLRLIASFLLVVLVTIGVVVVVTLRQTAQEVQTFMFRGGLTNTDRVVTALENYYDRRGTWEGIDNFIFQFTSQNNRLGPGLGQGRWVNQQADLPPMRLVDPGGNILFDTQQPEAEGRVPANELIGAIPLRSNGEIEGYLLPEGHQVFTPAEQQALTGRLNRTAAIAVLVAGVAAVLLALFLAYSLLRPVRALTQAASSLGAGDLSQRVPIQGNDELATLGRTFNRMAESLQQAEESRRALTADIAHELRTPLAVQRAHLEALEDGIYDLTLKNLTPIEEQNRLLTRLVDDLRTLALADADQLNLELTHTDLPALIQRVVTRFEPQAGERSIQIQLTLGEACPPLRLDPQRIEQILHNLLDNAIRYTPQGGIINVALKTTPKIISLSIHDSGSGIPEEALPLVFERFYRVDKSRVRSEGGTGLGLSIARKIALAHGGDLTAANHPEGGAVFTLSLPRSHDHV